MSFHQRLPPPIGTGIEVGLIGWLSVVLLDDILRPLCRQVDGAPTEVRNLLRMAKGPAGVLRLPVVSAIGAGRGKPATQIAGELLVSDGACKPAIAYAEKTPVPILLRHPDFKMDF